MLSTSTNWGQSKNKVVKHWNTLTINVRSVAIPGNWIPAGPAIADDAPSGSHPEYDGVKPWKTEILPQPYASWGWQPGFQNFSFPVPPEKTFANTRRTRRLDATPYPIRVSVGPLRRQVVGFDGWIWHPQPPPKSLTGFLQASAILRCDEDTCVPVGFEKGERVFDTKMGQLVTRIRCKLCNAVKTQAGTRRRWESYFNKGSVYVKCWSLSQCLS